jgi:hypothetical protein
MDTKIDLVTARLRLQHPDWSFHRVFTEAVEESGQTGSFSHDPVDKGTKLVVVAKDSKREIKPPSPSARPKLLLIQGAHAGWAFNIHTGERAV